ncbi:flagellar hook-associated protein FlgK [Macromonas nakdongensis]|uniref:flagellar hook-associated protein FlgK n=1 Tax=Macromonas nakdongensis TaxID=1843082 RepID=UPI000C3253DE|nr:flagellar hook-associated protein FlgK [Macromonas nakdongensis]
MSSLNIATRALTTNLSALQVVGNNIANVNTEGYSRQVVSFNSVAGQRLGGSYFGKGVELESVTRIYDQLLAREAQLTQSVASSEAVLYQRLQQVEDLFPMGESGLGAALNDALNAWVDVSSSPTDLTARTVVLSRTEDFTQQLNSITKTLDELWVSARQQVDATMTSINELAKQIAALNVRIVEGQSATAVPNELLDQRDQLLRQLNTHIQTTAVVSDSGAMTVFVGGSLPLVLGGEAFKLARSDTLDPPPTDAPLDPKQIGIALDRDGQPYSISQDLLRGGELNGLVRFINNELNDATNLLGRMALGTAVQMNEQHALGLNLNGDMQPDNPLFSLAGGYLSMDGIDVSFSAIPSRTSAPALTATVEDPSAFIASNYEVRITDAAAVPPTGSMVRLSDGKAFAFTVDTANNNQLVFGSGTSLDGLGFSLAASPALASGDRYLIKPFADASRNIGVAISRPEQLAAASAVMVRPDLQAGSGLGVETFSVVGFDLVSGSMPATRPTLELTYDDTTGQFNLATTPTPIAPATATVSPSTLTYSPGQPLTAKISINDGAGNVYTIDYSVTLRGAPADGDTITMLPPGPGDDMRQNAGNAQAMLTLRDVPTFEGIALSDGYVSVFSEVAARVQAAKFAAEFSETKAVSAETARANVAGVNLDEEAARMLQYQQSYQAAAKYLQTVQGTFDTLINSFG